MDPMEDPDDILRANRSREKTYMFDVAFDYSASQVSQQLNSLQPNLNHSLCIVICHCICVSTTYILILISVQEEVYRATTRGLIEGLISGYNATVFAYGPTGLFELVRECASCWLLTTEQKYSISPIIMYVTFLSLDFSSSSSWVI